MTSGRSGTLGITFPVTVGDDHDGCDAIVIPNAPGFLDGRRSIAARSAVRPRKSSSSMASRIGSRVPSVRARVERPRFDVITERDEPHSIGVDELLQTCAESRSGSDSTDRHRPERRPRRRRRPTFCPDAKRVGPPPGPPRRGSPSGTCLGQPARARPKEVLPNDMERICLEPPAEPTAEPPRPPAWVVPSPWIERDARVVCGESGCRTARVSRGRASRADNLRAPVYPPLLNRWSDVSWT